MKNQIRFWDKLARSYDKQSLKTYNEAYEATIRRSIPYVDEHSKVLDFGCGTGITTLRLAGMAANITAVDISGNMIDEAKKKAHAKHIENISFYVGTLTEMILDTESFDAVTAFNVLHFIDEPTAILQRFHSLLKPEGVFLSATDCMAERRCVQSLVYTTLAKLGILPSFSSMNAVGLKSLIQRAGFEIIESARLFVDPPNIFIAARKRGTHAQR